MIFLFWAIVNNSFDTIRLEQSILVEGLEVPHFEVTIPSAGEAFDAEPSS